MPEMRHYTVTQTREVEVTANSITDAALLASAAFEHGQASNGSIAHSKGPEGIWGNTDKLIKERSLIVERLG